MPDISPDQDLDLTFLYEIADGSDEFIIESIGMFLQQSPEILEKIGNALNAGQWVAAAQDLHKIKPNLGFFGMPVSQTIIQEIELACKTGAPDAAVVLEKFNRVNAMISANLITLGQLKEEKEAGL